LSGVQEFSFFKTLFVRETLIVPQKKNAAHKQITGECWVIVEGEDEF